MELTTNLLNSMSFNFESIMYSLKFKKTINNPKNALQAPLQFVRGIPVTSLLFEIDTKNIYFFLKTAK